MSDNQEKLETVEHTDAQANPQEGETMEFAPPQVTLVEFTLLKGTIKLVPNPIVYAFIVSLDFYSTQGMSLETILKNLNINVDADIFNRLQELGY